jgi:L-fuculose-phosphate aldolase
VTPDEGREAVLATCRALADRGFLAGTGGNVAVRVDGERFAVTPSATDYDTMTPEDICLVPLADPARAEGGRRPSVESGLHARLLRARPGCGTSIHTHQPLASAFTLLGRPLEVVAPEHRDLLGPTVACAGYAPSGTGWLASKVALALGPAALACLMRNHGAVLLGDTPETAIRRVEALEAECAAFFKESLEQRHMALPPSVMERVRAAVAPPGDEESS